MLFIGNIISCRSTSYSQSYSEDYKVIRQRTRLADIAQKLYNEVAVRLPHLLKNGDDLLRLADKDCIKRTKYQAFLYAFCRRAMKMYFLLFLDKLYRPNLLETMTTFKICL